MTFAPPIERLHEPATAADGVRPTATPRAAEEPALDPRDRRGPFRPERLSSARRRLDGGVLKSVFQTVDTGLVVVLTLALLEIGHPHGTGAAAPTWSSPFLVGPLLLLWALRALHTYDFSRRERLAFHVVKVLSAVTLGAAGALGVASLVSPSTVSSMEVWTVLAAAGVLAAHGLAWSAVRGWRREGRLTPNLVVVGATANAGRLIEAALRSNEMAVLGIFDDRADRVPPSLMGVPVLGDTRALLTHRIMPYVDTVVITVSARAEARVRELIDRLAVLPNALTLFVESETEADATLSRLADAPLRHVAGARFDARRVLVKRLADVILAAAGLLALTPVLALIALAVRLDSPGPILFRQRRHGFNNEAIVVWKFRSMRREAADATAARQVSAGDDRVTRVGRFIRRTSLDELPQLWNVLRGEMSLVGPRPHAIGMLTAGQDAADLVAEYAWRHRMKPGITGWAQIHGSRGPVHTAEDIRRRVALDVDYIERQSFWLDLYIMLMTLPRLLGDREAVR